jgi:hypothetical protein
MKHAARRPEAAVAQRRIGLEQANALKVHVQPFQRTGDVQQPRLLRLS